MCVLQVRHQALSSPLAAEGEGEAPKQLGVKVNNVVMELRKIANHPMLRCDLWGGGGKGDTNILAA